MPFVVGLPAPLPPSPTPTPFATNDDDDDGNNSNNKNNTPPTSDRETTDGAVGPNGGISEEIRAKDAARTNTKKAGKGFPGSDAVGESPSILGSAAVGERRAMPVPVPNSYGAGGGNEEAQENEGPKNRAGFHSYDETHQVKIIWWGSKLHVTRRYVRPCYRCPHTVHERKLSNQSVPFVSRRGFIVKFFNHLRIVSPCNITSHWTQVF